jgi:Calcineurin-like phosphoesterase
MLTILRRATDLFRNTPGRRGGLITLVESAEEVMVVGDLHGNIPAFRQILISADLARNPGRHLVLQELVHGPRYYPDEQGDKSHQLVDLVSALKCQHPDQVHLILGNHELSELTGRPIAKAGVPLNALFRQGIGTAYGDSAEAIYQSYLRLFAALPLAIRTANRVFLCHTIPDPIDLETFDVGIFEADEWSGEAKSRHGAVYAITWGRNTDADNADRFAELVDADLFITGHTPCEEGYRQANHRQIIIDGTEPYPAYCLFRAREAATVETLLKGVRVFTPVV